VSLSRATTEDQIARYRSLLLGDDELADDKASDVDMEMTWVPDPSELKVSVWGPRCFLIIGFSGWTGRGFKL